jgi:integrase
VARGACGARDIESLPPYDLRHAFASLQIRAGFSIPEPAEQMRHSPAMTLGRHQVQPQDRPLPTPRQSRLPLGMAADHGHHNLLKVWRAITAPHAA